MITLVLGLTACPGDDPEGQDTGGTDTSGTTGPDTNPTTDPDDTGGCVLGQSGCACLEGQCIGGIYCVDDMCVLGPQVEVDQGPSVVGGVVVRIEGQVEADSFTWEQVSGPTVEILGSETLNIAVVVPPDANGGDEIVLRLSATRNGVMLSDETTIGVRGANFENALPDIADPLQLGTPEGIDFGGMGMFVVNSEGFVSRFDDDGAFIESYDVAGIPGGGRFSVEDLIIANREGTGRVQRLNEVSGNLTTLFNTIEGGGPLGAVDSTLPDVDGNIYVSTNLDQTVLRYDAEAGVAIVFLEHASVVNPNALAFGPEGNNVYVGAQGHVWRVPLTDMGVAGEPVDYVVLDPTDEVDGLVFDEGNNLWIGCTNNSTLYIAHYSVGGPAEISRTFSNVGGGVSGFSNLEFGRGDVNNGEFGRDVLYYTNPLDGTVGRLRVGLRKLDSPLD